MSTLDLRLQSLAARIKERFDALDARVTALENGVPTTIPPPPVYPVGTGTPPVLAYSAYKLIEAYSGPAYRVVRPSDGATLDVGFVGQNLDTTALDTHLGNELGHVSIAYNQPGNGYDATQTTDSERPLLESGSVEGGPITFSGKRPLIFNGARMAIPSGVSIQRNSCHIFMVWEPLLGASIFAGLLQLGSGSNQATLYQSATVLGGNAFPSLVKPIEQRPVLIEIICDGASGTINQDFDTSSEAISGATLVGGLLGGSDIGDIFGSGYLSALVVYDRVLTGTELTDFRANMRSLFGLISVPNSGRVICVGDSIIAAASPPSLYEYGFVKMAQRHLANSLAFYNQGVGGAQIGGGISPKLASYNTDGAHPILTAFSDTRVVLSNYGTNDLTLGGRTAAEIYNDHVSYAALVHDDGGLYVPCTMLPDGNWNGTQQTTWSGFNDLMRADTTNFDGLCDFAADSTMGSFSAASNALLYKDGLHPTRLGHTYLMPIALDAINAALL